MDDRNKPQISRRNITKMLFLSTVAMSAPFVITPSRAVSKKIVIRDSGGLSTQAYGDAFYKPFTQATGIEVISVTSEPEPIAQIQTMVETNRYLWDMVDIASRAVLSLTTGNIYLEKHGLEDDPLISLIPPQFVSPYGIGNNVYSSVLAYRLDAFKGRRAPESWKDLWDADSFPGRRGLRKLPFDTIEEALMADGVPPNNVYPCDLDRAFRSLDTIKPSVTVWWKSASQAEQLLKSGEVDLMPTFNSRAQSAVNTGAPIAFALNQHLYDCNTWAILKGTPRAEACRQFIKFAADPKRQALLAPYALGPTQPDAFKYIDPKQAVHLPSYPDNLKKGLHVNAAYWFKNRDIATGRFNDWLLS